MADGAFMTVLDHLVVATPDLQKSIAELAELLGVVAAPGGKHPKWRTQNAVLSLGPRMYLEIMGPDGGGRPVEAPRPFGIDRLQSRRLASWVAHSSDLCSTVSIAKSEGIDLGQIQKGSRTKPDGALLEWEMTDLMMDREGGIVPYFIDWGKTAHPGISAPTGCRLESLKVFHPRAAWITAALQKLGIDLIVEEGPAGIDAQVAGPGGRVILR
jgi:hypothetical protein